MTELELKKEARRQRRLEKLGTNKPRCGVCGESSWQCLELHHAAGQAHGDATVILCRNCHRKATDDQKDHPRSNPEADRTLCSIGYFLLGLADMLRLVVEKLYAFGCELVERSQAHCLGERP